MTASNSISAIQDEGFSDIIKQWSLYKDYESCTKQDCSEQSFRYHFLWIMKNLYWLNHSNSCIESKVINIATENSHIPILVRDEDRLSFPYLLINWREIPDTDRATPIKILKRILATSEAERFTIDEIRRIKDKEETAKQMEVSHQAIISRL
jgi:hypothetical protein